MWSCHSSWFTVFGEHGFPGFLLWLGVISSSFLSLKKLRSVGNNYESLSWIARCASMIGIALTTFLIVDSFIDAAYFDFLYYLIGIVIILKEIARATVAEASPIVNRLVVHRPVVVSGMAIGRGGNQ